MKCEVCEERDTLTRIYAASGGYLELCAMCASELMLGSPIVDSYGFEWTLGSDGSPRCVHTTTEVYIGGKVR